MPNPNYSDPALIQWMQDITQRLRALEWQQTGGVIDPQGRVRLKYGLLPSGSYGLAAYDASGNLRIQMGELPNGDDGILLVDSVGNQQELLPAVSQYVATTLSTTSTTPVSIAGSPSVTCVIGQSGDFKVTCGSDIGVDPNCSGLAFLLIDGGTAHSIIGVSCSDPTNGIAANVQSTRRWSQWIGGTVAPGSHTFTMEYSSSSGTANFSANWLEVAPI